jgi:hypothetical protein
VSHRPLAIVSGLTIGDYLLWNWSLNGGHDVLALVSGLSLPPLTIACVWLVALTVARTLAHSSSRDARRMRSRTRRDATRRRASRRAPARNGAAAIDQAATTATSPTPANSSRKLAA